jgi:hypothetical protein
VRGGFGIGVVGILISRVPTDYPEP